MIIYSCLDPVPYRRMEFVEEEGIQLFQYAVTGNKEPHQMIDTEVMAEAVSKIL
eukprot:Pgem_evm1s10879